MMTTKLSHSSSSHHSVRCQQRGIYSRVYNLLGTPTILLTHYLGAEISEGERVPLLLVLLLLDHILLSLLIPHPSLLSQSVSLFSFPHFLCGL